MSRKGIVVIIIFICVALSTIRFNAYASVNVIVTSLTANDGLSNNTVWAVLQDKAGFIWIGTADGLDRYDGREIRHFSPDIAFAENNAVLSLCEDDLGKIWVGTNSGLCVYNPETEQEQTFPLNIPGVDEGGLRVYQIVKASDGTLWVPAGRYGFITVNPYTMDTRQITESSDGSVNYFGGALCFDGRDHFYLVMNDGNIYSSTDKLASAAPLFDKAVINYLPRYLHYAFGNLFMGVADDNLKIDIRTKKISKTPWAAVRVSGHSANDELWVANMSGLHILDPDLMEKKVITMDTDSRLSFQSKSIMCACRDRDGNIWVGTYYSGIFHLINNKANLQKHYPRHIDDDEPSHVREIIPDQDGTVWVATEDKGLLRYYPEEERFEHITLPVSALNIQSLCDGGDCLWVGAYAQSPALAKLDKQSGSVTLMEDAPRRIFSICTLKSGGIAIGGSSGLSIFRDDEYRAQAKITGGVQEVMEDSHGHLWISTSKDGLWCCLGDVLDPQAQWIHYTNESDNPLSIPSNKVTSVFEDHNSRVWVTTEAGGFCLLDPSAGTFKRYVDTRQTAYKVCYKVSEDQNGILWITTSKGLLCFNPDTEAAALLTRKDGMLSNQYNYSSNVISRDGTLYAGSGDGLISFEPDKIIQLLRNSSIMLTDFEVLESKTGKDEAGFHLKKSINVLSSLTLKHKYNSFRIKVATDNYDIPVINRLSYRLEGIDNEWTDINDGVIEINRLKSGKYHLIIRVMRLNGVMEPDSRRLGITVNPPLMASAPFIVAYVLMLMSLLFVFRWWITRRMKEKQARELLDSQMEFVTTMAHEIKTPLTLVQGSMELVRDSIQRPTGKGQKDNLDVAFKNLDRIRELVSQLQDFSSLEMYGRSMEHTQVNLSEQVILVSQRFASEAELKHIRLDIDIPDRPFIIISDRDAVDKIATNLLSNAIKYAKSFAKVSLIADNRQCYLEVVNDGVVIPAEHVESIFEPFVRYPDNSQTIPGMGIGLSTSRKLARMLGGDIIYKAHGVNLNTFTLLLPIAKEEASFKIHNGVQVPQQALNSQAGNANKTVLVVEDNPEMLSFIVEQLSSDYKVLKASSGNEALSVLMSVSSTVNLILSDVMMPGMDGFEFCRQIKENIMTSHLPVLLLTAKTDIRSKVEGLQHGADMYLEKPFSLDHLKAAIQSVFKNREQIRKHYLSHPFDYDSWAMGNSVDSAFLNRLMHFVESNIENESLRISDIADAACISESHLYKKTKALLNMSPLEYVQFLRLKKAETMLLESDIPISEIGVRVGFGSHPYFSACFKKQYGMTPSQFRKEHSY